jgi:hypothetical protein
MRSLAISVLCLIFLSSTRRKTERNLKERRATDRPMA